MAGGFDPAVCHSVTRVGTGVLTVIVLAACASGPAEFQPRPGQGQYVRPAYLNAVPTSRLPEPDACNARVYQGLIGQHEGAIYVAGLPGAKRVLKPAFTEEVQSDFPVLPEDRPPFVEVRDYLPGQVIYAPSIRAPDSLVLAGETRTDRLTIELDREGYVQEVICR